MIIKILHCRDIDVPADKSGDFYESPLFLYKNMRKINKITMSN